MPLVVRSASDVINNSNPISVVSSFQNTPPYEMYCKDKTWGEWEPINVGSKFESLLSKEFYRLFLWSLCWYPSESPHYADSRSEIYYDIRFGFENGSITNQVKNIRIKPAQYQGPDKATVKLIFDPTNYTFKNITTTYTLIREGGHWKIDDIAPKGDTYDDPEQESALQSSASIKTDMQNNYSAAMKRYQEEQAKKGAVPQK